MARIRTIKPEFCVSEQIVECSTSARLLFATMWMWCDDWGVHPAKPGQLKMECFPGDPFTVEEVVGWIGELLRVGLLFEFVGPPTETDGGDSSQLETYWYVTGWEKHQKIDRRGARKYPAPPSNTRRVLDECSTSPRD